MTELEDLEAANRRWTILRLLAGDPDHETEVRLIHKALASINRAHRVGLDVVRRDALWLERRLLVTVEIDDERVYVKLTQRGRDVADGAVRVEGVDDDGLE